MFKHKKTQKKAVRQRFRDLCFQRDKHKCACCGSSTDDLTVHHISPRREMPNGGYVLENGITVCPECHIKAEYFYGSTPDHAWLYQEFTPHELFKLINSSFDEALKASTKKNE
jgi:5-methylcytosine-specific restriction endonuclease McrA